MTITEDVSGATLSLKINPRHWIATRRFLFDQPIPFADFVLPSRGLPRHGAQHPHCREMYAVFTPSPIIRYRHTGFLWWAKTIVEVEGVVVFYMTRFTD